MSTGPTLFAEPMSIENEVVSPRAVSYTFTAVRALIAFGLVLLLAAAFLLTQSRTAPELWDQWRRHQRTVTLADVLCFRHVPRLPGTGPSSPPIRA